jgi:hypothetical protein
MQLARLTFIRKYCVKAARERLLKTIVVETKKYKSQRRCVVVLKMKKKKMAVYCFKHFYVSICMKECMRGRTTNM